MACLYRSIRHMFIKWPSVAMSPSYTSSLPASPAYTSLPAPPFIPTYIRPLGTQLCSPFPPCTAPSPPLSSSSLPHACRDSPSRTQHRVFGIVGNFRPPPFLLSLSSLSSPLPFPSPHPDLLFPPSSDSRSFDFLPPLRSLSRGLARPLTSPQTSSPYQRTRPPSSFPSLPPAHPPSVAPTLLLSSFPSRDTFAVCVVSRPSFHLCDEDG